MVDTIEIVAVVFIIIGIILMDVCMYFPNSRKDMWTYGLLTALAGSAFITIGCYILLELCCGKEIIYFLLIHKKSKMSVGIDDITINHIIVAVLQILCMTFLMAEVWMATLCVDTTLPKYIRIANIGMFLAWIIASIFFGVSDFMIETTLLMFIIMTFFSVVLGVVFIVHHFHECIRKEIQEHNLNRHK